MFYLVVPLEGLVGWRLVTVGLMRRIAVSLALLTFLASPSPASVSTNVPLGHWSYGEVEKLANYGLIDSSMLTIKPLSRLEMARHVGQALDALELMEDAPEVLR